MPSILQLPPVINYSILRKEASLLPLSLEGCSSGDMLFLKAGCDGEIHTHT